MALSRQPEVLVTYREPQNGAALTLWREDLDAVHRSFRARIEHGAGADEAVDPARLPRRSRTRVTGKPMALGDAAISLAQSAHRLDQEAKAGKVRTANQVAARQPLMAD